MAFIPKDLVTYSKVELEQMAALELRRRPDVSFLPPINVELLIENSSDICLKPLGGLRSKHRVAGCVCKKFMSRDLTVFVDEEIYCGCWPEYNEVLGEEYAHIRLHRSLFNLVQEVEDFVSLQQDPQWPNFESDARYFSMAVRMPRDLLVSQTEQIYPVFVNHYGFSDAKIILSKIRANLAETFKTSMSEMTRRFHHLKELLNDRIEKSVLSRSQTLIHNDRPYKAVVPNGYLNPLNQNYFEKQN